MSTGELFEGGKRRLVVTTVELADLFDVSKVAITHWKKEGLPAYARDRWDLSEVIRWREDWWRRRGKSHPADESDERLELIRAQTRKYEVETARLEAQLIPRDEVLHVLHTLAAIVSSTLEGAPARLAPELADHRGDISLTRDALLREFRALRAQIADRIEAFADAPPTPSDSPDPKDDDGNRPPAPDPHRRRVGRRKPSPAGDESGAGPLEDGPSPVLAPDLPRLQ